MMNMSPTMMSCGVTIFILLSLVSVTFSVDHNKTIVIDSNNIDRQIDSLISKVVALKSIEKIGILKQMDQDLASYASNLNIDVVIKILQKIKSSLRNENSDCFKDIVRIIKSAMTGKLWALKALDYSAKFESGLLEGNNRWAGSYSNCISLNENIAVENGSDRNIQGKYCWVKVAFNSKRIFKKSFYDLNFALCVPDSCSEKFIESIVSEIPEIFPATKTHMKIVNSKCLEEFTYWGDSYRAMGLIILCSCLAFLAIAGIYTKLKETDENLESSGCYQKNICNGDVNLALGGNDKTNEKSVRFIMENGSVDSGSDSSEKSILLSDDVEIVHPQKDADVCTILAKNLSRFSVFNNSSPVFDLTPEEDNVLKVLHGIRVASLSWFFFGNAFYLMLPVLGNSFFLAEFENTFWCKIIVGSTFAVDSFLLISGLLMVYTKMKEAPNYSINSWVCYFVERYLRLMVPMFITIVLFDILLHSLYTNGPFYRYEHEYEADNCETKWWQNLLLINNYESPLKSCHPYSWFLATLFQLSLLSPFAFVLISCNTYVAAISGVVIIAAVSLITGLISIGNDLSSQVGFKFFFEEGIEGISQRFMSVQEQVLMKPYCRASPFIIGLACGYYLYKMNGKIIIKDIYVALGWMLSAVAVIILVFGNVEGEPGALLSAIYYSSSPIIWSLVLAWTIIACSNGYGRYIDLFFTWEFWYPFSRITYSSFLIHNFVGKSLFNLLERQLEYNQLILCVVGGSIVGMSYLGGFFFHVAIEAPILSLLKNRANDRSS